MLITLWKVKEPVAAGFPVVVVFFVYFFPATLDGDRFCLYKVTRCIIWSNLTRSNDVFEALITFGLIWTTCIFLFCTDRLVCLNKSVNASLLVDLHLRLLRTAVGLLVEASLIIVFDLLEFFNEVSISS